MKRFRFLLIYSLIGLGTFCLATNAFAQAAKASEKAPPPQNDDKSPRAYSGMYTFLKEGEFLQVTVEEDGSVTGFVSRFGDGESDKGAFLDQFFKSGKLDGNKLSFTTEIVHGVAFDFHGTIERGEGKNPGEEAYFVLKGTLTENTSDANKKVTSHSREVVFKIFPQEAQPPAADRK
ncbi:MAG TPA: hypothetical protein VE377_03305 [Candidatus Dormibacteraeota bacterium]|nr:hypothetical protein [Candidatus Dormibacteraeota bacterium]